MHATKIIHVPKDELRRCHVATERGCNYNALGVKSRRVYQSWSAKFPKSMTLTVTVSTGRAELMEPFKTTATLSRNGNVIETRENIDFSEEYLFQIDERTSYKLILTDRKRASDPSEAFENTRYVQRDKFEEYEAIFEQNVNAPDPRATDAMRSAWEINFPHSCRIIVNVREDKHGTLYARATLTKKKRKFKPIMTEPVTTLTRPFVIQNGSVRYIVKLAPGETKRQIEKKGDDIIQ